MSIDSAVLMLVLFLAGTLSGSITQMRDEIPPNLSKLIPNGIFCGLFGIIGGAIPDLFLASQNHIVTIASGIGFSHSIALFSNEEIKTFLAKIIKYGIAKLFNWRLGKNNL